MPVSHYRRKPFFVQAVQFTGYNACEIAEFMGHQDWCQDEVDELVIETLEGDMKAQVGDYIVKGVTGEFYPCNGPIFERIHEAVENAI